MKKIIVSAILSLGLFGFAIAQNTSSGQNTNSSGNSNTDCTTCTQNQNTVTTNNQAQTSNQGEASQLSNNYQIKVNLSNEEKNQLEKEVNLEVENQLQLLQGEVNQAQKGLQPTLQQQIQAKSALQALFQVANMLQAKDANLEPYVQQLQNTFNSSFSLQQKIAQRSQFAQFFIGSDRASVDALRIQTQNIANQIEELQSHIALYDSQTASFINQYIDSLLSEYDTLVNEVQTQEKNRGIFYWMFGWLWGYK